MARPCTVCTHPDHLLIDAALLDGASLSSLARAYGLIRQSIGRHVQSGHLADAVRTADAQAGEIRTEALADSIAGLHARTLALLTEAETAKEGKVAIAAVREARQQIETLMSLRLVQLNAPDSSDADERPEIDEAIIAALEARGDTVNVPTADREKGKEAEHPIVPDSQRAIGP